MQFLRQIPFICIILYTLGLSASESGSAKTINLNGSWEMGYDRNYNRSVTVPGIHTNPATMEPSALWYKKEIVLPEGNWTNATLELKGARFSPEVFINGKSVSQKEGGMAATFHLLNHNEVKPGHKIIIEIALKSLKDISSSDASCIPVADQWRSNVSSSLWSDVVLKLHGGLRIDRIIPFTDFSSNQVKFAVHTTSLDTIKKSLVKGRIEIFDEKGNLVLFSEKQLSFPLDYLNLKYGDLLKSWSPENPNLYKVKLSLTDGKDTIDQSEISFGIRDFRIVGKKFYLNDEPISLLGGTVVWHRWARDPEAKNLLYDTDWFTKNVILNLKERGANYLRFHLGVPPESFLDLCDQYGLLVQYEWSFFHGMPAGRESLMEQFPPWFDLAMRHPSVVLFHPYNETEGEQLKTIWSALNEIVQDYPPLVMEERDVTHIHKYWWSLFENLGLYYDSADQFPKAIMVDEFGGNYLDGEGNMGGYKTVPEAFLRFLGRNHTKESRLKLHTLANAEVAEYWRRIDAAGVAPFCILGSPEDGSHWYTGNLSEGNLKPVWDALTAAWSPRSVSLEIWDRNFISGQKMILPVYLFNDTRFDSNFNIRFQISNEKGEVWSEKLLNFKNVPAFNTQIKNEEIILPREPGRYILSAELINRPKTVKYSVVSQWEVHIFQPEVPEILLRPGVGVATDEDEIIQFLQKWKIKNVPLDDPDAKIILLSKEGWNKIAGHDTELLKYMESSIQKGKSVVLLDAVTNILDRDIRPTKMSWGLCREW